MNAPREDSSIPGIIDGRTPQTPILFRDRFRSYWKATGAACVFYLLGKFTDTLITWLDVARHGVEMEANPIYLLSMGIFGTHAGMFVTLVGELLIFLPISFKRERLFDIRMKSILYIMGIAHFFGAATHIPNFILWEENLHFPY